MENNKIKKIIIIAFALIIIILVCVITYLLLKDNKASNSNNMSNNTNNTINNVVDDNQTNNNNNNNNVNNVANNNQTNNTSNLVGKTLTEVKALYKIYESENSSLDDKLVYELHNNYDENIGLLLFNKSDKKLSHIFNDKKLYSPQINKIASNAYVIYQMNLDHPVLGNAYYILDSNYNTIIDSNKLVKYLPSVAKYSSFSYPVVLNNYILIKEDSTSNYYQFDSKGNYVKKINSITDFMGDYYIKQDGNVYKIYDINQKYINTLITLKNDMYFIASVGFGVGREILHRKDINEFYIDIYQGNIQDSITPNLDNNSKCYRYLYNIKTNQVNVENKNCSEYNFFSTEDGPSDFIVTREWKA